MQKTLWTKNFTILTVGTIISSIGGVAMNFALSFVVFDQSGSTLMSGIFGAISMIPAFVLPILISPYIDHFPRKPFIVSLDAFNGILYLLFSLYLMKFSFVYLAYLIFSLCVTSIGTVYNLAYTSLYPNLIPEGFAQKGYTISSMIYPTVNILITPVAAVLYEHFGLTVICMMEGSLLLLASLMETQIKIKERVVKKHSFALKQYRENLKEGFRYLREEKGLQRIFTYMAVTQGKAEGENSLIVAYFQTTPGLGVTLYSAFTVVEFIGRSIGGVVHYRIKLKPEKRFSFAYLVYLTYSIMDALLLWLAYPLMLLNRSICGFLGIQSAALRESSVQKYVPDDKRAKINAFFNTFVSLSSMCMRLIIGWLGEILPYRYALSLVAIIEMLVGYVVVFCGKKDISRVYDREY